MSRKSQDGLLSLIKSHLFAVLFFIVVAAMMLAGLKNTANRRREQAISSATDSIRRAIVTCYALEGSYPESLDYIKQHYGVHLNDDEFAVFYDVFGGNIMPHFRVVPK